MQPNTIIAYPIRSYGPDYDNPVSYSPRSDRLQRMSASGNDPQQTLLDGLADKLARRGMGKARLHHIAGDVWELRRPTGVYDFEYDEAGRWEIGGSGPLVCAILRRPGTHQATRAAGAA